MEEIKEVFDGIREKIGDKGFFIFIGVALLFGLYNLLKGSNVSENELTPVKGVYSYPDVVTNANVVIDTLQDSIEYSENRITDKIDKTYEDLGIQIGTNFETTNDYINKGFASQEKLLEENFDDLNGTLDKNFDDLKAGQNNISSSIDNMKSEINSSLGSINSSIGGINSSIGSMQSEIAKNTASIGSLKSSSSSSGGSKPATTTKPSNSSGSTSNSNTLQYTTKAGLNTSTSIVDALKATGTDSSFEHRAELYYKNGGTGTYTGSYSQNVSMLNKLKSGTLKG